MTAKLAIATPVVTMNPAAHAPWEEDASIEDLGRVAEAADRLGYHHLTCSEHVGLPVGGTRPTWRCRYWDPLATFGYLAARTERSASPPTCWCSATTTRSRSPSATARSTGSATAG